jgi:hypothetical protein
MALLILFYSFDNILAFKGAICYCFGSFLMIIISIYYTSDRPFWVDGNIRTYQGFCQFDFSCPSQHMLSIVFLMNYNIYMYFVKYTQKPNYKLVSALFVLSSIFAGVVAFGLNLLGNIYLY